MTSQSSQPRPLRVFLSHASDDKPAVRELAAYLRFAGIDVWLDEDKILPGQDWKTEIATAVRESDAIIVCLSQKTASKEGYVQREIRLALDVAEEKPEGTIFVIPVRLENSSVPERLSRWQWVDLFPDSGAGREKLGEALVRRAQTMGSVAVPALDAKGEVSGSPEFKYFYYVSRPKLDLLAAQFGLGAATAPGEAVRDVHAIKAALGSKGLVKELAKEQDVKTGQFYSSSVSWRHGLFYFRAGFFNRGESLLTGVMYVLWRTHGDSLLLLTGSPEHILGEKLVREGLFVHGSSGAVDEVLKIAQGLSVDEPALLTGKQVNRWNFEAIPGFEVRADPPERDEVSSSVPLPYSWGSESNALSLAMFCFRRLARLGSARLDVLFRLFSRESAVGSSLQDDLDARRERSLSNDYIRKDPRRLTEEQAHWERVIAEVRQYQLGRYRQVYVGSPIYTALL